MAAPPPPHGGIGVGTWSTDSEYKDLKVTKGDQVLFQTDLAQGTAGWKTVSGEWKVDQDAGTRVLHQTSNNTDCRIWTGDPAWSDYTTTLKARKLGGNEGFLVLFNVQNNDNFMWWNIGGWTNTRTAVEAAENGSKREVGPAKEGLGVESNRWYDLTLVLSGNHFLGYVDGQLVTDVTYKAEEPPQPMFATASRDASTGELIVKVVNVSANPQQLEVNLQGTTSVDKAGSTIEVISGQPTDINSVGSPEKVAPKKAALSNAGPNFVHEFPAYSVSVMRLKTR
jgi:alpha-L-arabinofuranosidase